MYMLHCLVNSANPYCLTCPAVEIQMKLCSITLSTDDWRSDQYRWISQGVRGLPKKDPLLRKSYFQLHTPEGPSKEFTRNAYQLLHPGSSELTLIHYVGNENAASKTRNVGVHEHALLFYET